MRKRVGTGRVRTRRRLSAVAVAALMLPALIGSGGFETVGDVDPDVEAEASPGDLELHNLKHVYNFDPQDHDPDQHPSVGSDLEFFSATVPLRDYSTGAYLNKGGQPVPAHSKFQPIMAERDFAVMGSFQRGAYVFDITDPENTQFVTQVTCRQDRNDVGITRLVDENGDERVVLALTQQTGDPCGGGGDGAVGFRVDGGGFHDGVQWAGTAAVDPEVHTGKLVYVGTGCSIVNYLAVAGESEPFIAVADGNATASNPADQCPRSTYFQRVNAAELAGAVGFIQIPGLNADGEPNDPNGNATAVHADIPGIEVHRTEEVLAVLDDVITGEEVQATIDMSETDANLIGEGSGGIGVFDITDPYEWEELYRLRTGHGGVHNFIFHPTEPYGYVSNGALPGGLNELPIVDFTELHTPKMIFAPDQTEGGIHDIEFSPDGTRAYAAIENNYRIYDTTNPENPQVISRAPNVGTYAHGVFPTSDLSLMVTNNESLALGGFFADGSGVCPGEGLAGYDITEEGTPIGPVGYYAPNVVGQTDARPCTSHFGRFAPDTRVMSIGWYIAGVRIVDWTDPSNPVEVAGAVMEDSNTWAAKFHEGPYVYAGDQGRGFDVFKWSGEGPAPWTVATDPVTTQTASSGAAADALASIGGLAGGSKGSAASNAPDVPAGSELTARSPAALGMPSSQGFTGTGTIEFNCRLLLANAASSPRGSGGG